MPKKGQLEVAPIATWYSTHVAQDDFVIRTADPTQQIVLSTASNQGLTMLGSNIALNKAITNAAYALDVAGTINATSLLVNGSAVGGVDTFSSNVAVFASNAGAFSSNALPSYATVVRANADSNGVYPMAAFGSNTSATNTTNIATNTTNIATNATNISSTLVTAQFGCNVAVGANSVSQWASNALPSYATVVRANADSNAVFPMAAYGSNTSSTNTTNIASTLVTAQFGSNAGVFASNAGVFSSNALPSYATVVRANADSNAVFPMAAYGSNTSATNATNIASTLVTAQFSSNAGVFSSNALPSYATVVRANADSNAVFPMAAYGSNTSTTNTASIATNTTDIATVTTKAAWSSNSVVATSNYAYTLSTGGGGGFSNYPAALATFSNVGIGTSNAPYMLSVTGTAGCTGLSIERSTGSMGASVTTASGIYQDASSNLIAYPGSNAPTSAVKIMANNLTTQIAKFETSGMTTLSNLTVTGTATGLGGTQLLTYLQYTAALLTATPSGTNVSADASAANLFVTFTAPSSGAVIVRLQGSVAQTGGGMLFSLRSGSSDVAGTKKIVSTGLASYTTRVTGLTPGASYTYKWGVAQTNGATTTYLQLNYVDGSGLDCGPGIMEVWSA